MLACRVRAWRGDCKLASSSRDTSDRRADRLTQGEARYKGCWSTLQAGLWQGRRARLQTYAPALSGCWPSREPWSARGPRAGQRSSAQRKSLRARQQVTSRRPMPAQPCSTVNTHPPPPRNTHRAGAMTASVIPQNAALRVPGLQAERSTSSSRASSEASTHRCARTPSYDLSCATAADASRPISMQAEEGHDRLPAERVPREGRSAGHRRGPRRPAGLHPGRPRQGRGRMVLPVRRPRLPALCPPPVSARLFEANRPG
jgi:hypothetical protein